MTTWDIIRAWKDEEYRNSLTEEQLAELPEHPAGAIELTDEELYGASGAETQHTWHGFTTGCGCGPLPTMGYTCFGFTVCGLVCNTAWCTLGPNGADAGNC